MARQRLHKDPPPDDPTPQPADPPAPSVADALSAACAADPAVDAALTAPPAGTPEAAPAPKARKPRAASAAAQAVAEADGAFAGVESPSKPAVSTAPTSAASLLAQQLADEIGEKNPLPFTDYPNPSAGLTSLVTKVIDEGLGLDLEQEFDLLVADLVLPDALTPQVVAEAINACEDNARRAHRVYVLAKYQFDRYKIEAEVALGAMRESATHKLAALKAGGHHPKQVTDSDVRDMAAIMYPDEWKDIQDRIARTEHTLAHIARFADLWQRRSWSLSSLNK